MAEILPSAPRPDLAPNLIPVPNGFTDVIQDLSQITSHLAVDLDGLGNPVEVLAGFC